MSRPLLFTVSSGLGPVEVRRFVRLLADRLATEIARRGAHIEHVITHGPASEPSSVDFAVVGERAALLDLIGTHALVQRSERRCKHSRKRWYAGVSCSERAPSAVPESSTRDVTFELCRAGGAGGQHVNRTESAVRAVHHPTGLQVRIQRTRSQHQNRRRALETLTRKLHDRHATLTAAAISERRAQSLRVERGRPVMTWHCKDGALVSMQAAS